MTTTRAEQAERTRQLVLQTAQQLFAEQSYDATSLQMIADAAGLAKANVYYYFHTKAEILAAITAPTISAMNALFDSAATIRSPRQRRQHLINGYADVLLANRDVANLASNDAAFRRERDLNLASQQMRDHGLQVLFGDTPTPEQRVAFHLLDNLAQAIPLLAGQSDDQARDILIRTCTRILHIAGQR